MCPESTIYLDNNATTQIAPEVLDAMVEVLGSGPLNPSSGHHSGDYARKLLEDARSTVADFVGACSEAVIFTSGATEANNLVLRSVGRSRGFIVTTRLEHPSVRHCVEMLEGEGVAVTWLPVDGSGVVSLGDVESAVDGSAVVSLQWVNSETGVEQPIAEVAAICERAGAILHVDASQAVGKRSLDLSQVGIEFLTFTGHKFHGPVGAGVVIAPDRGELRPMAIGGAQEWGVRGGTENVACIIGLAAACARRGRSLSAAITKMSELRDAFESRLLRELPSTRVNGGNANRICNTSNLLFAGVDGQALVARLDIAGVCCSQSSACTNRRPEPSYVLREMGLTEDEAYSSVRFGFSEFSVARDVHRACDLIIEGCRALEGTSPVALAEVV